MKGVFIVIMTAFLDLDEEYKYPSAILGGLYLLMKVFPPKYI